MSTSDSHPTPIPPVERARARTWVVDGANVIGSRPDGWWRDRAGAAVRLTRQIAELLAAADTDRRSPAGSPAGSSPADLDRLAGSAAAVHPEPPNGLLQLPDQVVVVLEGAAIAGVPSSARNDSHTSAQPAGGRRQLVVVHADGDGDDEIAAQAAAATKPVLVFTSDRGLRDRVKAVGADVAGARALTRLLPTG